MRYFFITIFSLITFFLLGLAGFKAGQFIFEKKTQALTEGNYSQIASSTPLINPFKEIAENFCADGIVLDSPNDKNYCLKKSNLNESRGIIVDLTNQKALLYDNWKIIKILPVAYQAKEGNWFQTPTGYFKVGIKKEHMTSSFVPVSMDYSVQFYEDFFMHAIPYHSDGTRVTSAFSGGCLRFQDKDAEEIFNFAQKGDTVIIAKNFDDLGAKSDFHMPVDTQNYWIRQRFNNPLRQFWDHKSNINTIQLDYYQHTGVDFAPNKDAHDLNAYAIADGAIAKIQPNIAGQDHGLGNTIILEHALNGASMQNPADGTNKIYSLYAHLDSINPGLKEGMPVNKGDVIGKIGNSGYGCRNYWKIGKDDCSSPTEQNPNDTHLHFEIKASPVLENPEGGEICQNSDYSQRLCYGYTPDDPVKYGYINPIQFLFNKTE